MTSTDTRCADRLVETPNGRVYVIDVPGDDPPVVLMHGFPDDHRIYTRLLPLLTPKRAVAFDFVGYGRSERSDNACFSPQGHGTEIGSVLDALHIERATLVGHDASGPDAIIYAVVNPDRVAHLVLLNTIFGHRPSLRMPEMTRLFSDPQLASLADDMVGDSNQLMWLLQRWGLQLGLQNHDPAGILTESILAQFYGDDGQPDALAAIRAWTAGLHDSLDQQEAVVSEDLLRRLDVPVSIVFGSDDRYLTPLLAAEIAALFPDPSVRLLADAGHYVQHDRAEQVAGILKEL